MFKCECKGCDCCKGDVGQCQRVESVTVSAVEGSGESDRLVCVECAECDE